MSKPIRIIINRQKATYNRKQKEKMPADRNTEEATISIHDGGNVDYAYGIRLGGQWNIVQDYANSPCSGAHIWLESTPSSTYEITHRNPRSEWDGTESDRNESDETSDVESEQPAPVEEDLDFDFL